MKWKLAKLMNAKIEGLISDAYGKPLKVYHGSETYHLLNEDRNTFFSITPNVANAYALRENDDYVDGSLVFSAYLSMKKPLITTRDFLTQYALKHVDFNQVDTIEEQVEKFADNFEDSFIEEREVILNYAKENGYDGLILPDDSLPIECLGGDFELQPSYVVFSAKQIHFHLFS